MFRWYRNAARCYAYLSDVSARCPNDGGPPPRSRWERAFRASRWFTRGWTLQELIAPSSVEFFSVQGTLLGNKRDLQQLVHENTGIAIRALCGEPLASFSIEERFEWAKYRQTTKAEDYVYSLLGIFGIYLAPIYGEGKESAVQRLLSAIDNANRATPFDINRKTDQILDIHRKVVLSKLPVAKGAAFHAHENEHDPSCHPDTRVDLLARVHTWIQDPNGKCIFWLCGMAGTGKSTISRTVAKKLSEAKLPSASFFFKKGEADRGRAAMFFTTVLAQLVVQLPELAPHLQSAIENDPAIVDKSKTEQFEQLLLEPLDKCKTSSSLVAVVVDALDECDREEDARGLVYLLSRSKEATSCRLRFFVTSRPELPIRLGFKEICGNYQHLALHDIPKQDVTRDIATYLSSELAHILQNFNKMVAGPGLPPNWPPPASLESLVNMALDKILENQKKGGWSQLHMTYLPILNQLLLKRTDSGSVRRTEGEAAEIVAWFRDIVGTIVLLADPLPSASLARVLGRSQLDVDSKLRGLHSVLDISDDPLVPTKLLHLSFRDFLVNLPNRDANPFWVDERETHKQLADRCLNLLSSGDTLKRDICGLRWPGTPRYEIDIEIINAALPPEVQYACRYWVYHWKKSGRKICDGDLVDDFLTRHLLYWLEALGIIGRIWETISMVDDLLSLLHPTESTAVAELLCNMRRLILGCCSIIDISPLQVHCSAIVFTPEGSVIRNKYQYHFPTWVSLMAQMEPDWGACLQTLEGHSYSINSVALSGDSRQLASASYDKTVKLWDAATGQCIATLKGHSGWVNSVAFSGDSRHLASASASYDNTVKLWDAATGQCLQTFDVDGELASISFDATGSCLYTDAGRVLLGKPSATSPTSIQASSQQPRIQGYSVSADNAWITCSGQNLLWLPSEYRPTASAVAGSTVVLGCASGRVLILRFSGEDNFFGDRGGV